MRNKKGWLRIFEAVLAIVLILSSLLLIYRSQQTTPREGEYILDWQVEVLSRIADDDNLRNATINEDNQTLINFINESLLPNLNFTVKICNLTGPCGMGFYVDRDIFVQERIIGGTLLDYDPRKIRFFVWRIQE